MDIHCTVDNCLCTCYKSCETTSRHCQSCQHSWLKHALSKLSLPSTMTPVNPASVFETASLLLYGAEAIPIKLKILLDKLLSILRHDQVIQLLNSLGWQYEDYARGYMLQDKHCNVVGAWALVSPEEEIEIIRQFLKFSETRSVADTMLGQRQSATQPQQQSVIMEFLTAEASKKLEKPKVDTDEDEKPERPTRQTNDNLRRPRSYSVDIQSNRHPHRRYYKPLRHFQRQNCEECGKRFHDSYMLNFHMAVAHREVRNDDTGFSFTPPENGETETLEDQTPLTDQSFMEAPSPIVQDNETSTPNIIIHETEGELINNKRKSVKPSKVVKWTLDGGWKEEDGFQIEDNTDSLLPIEKKEWRSPSPSNNDSKFGNQIQNLERLVTSMQDSEASLQEVTPDGPRCKMCDRIYASMAGFKQHYMNVHVRKSNHCWVQGCTASFPSKRSRDRHSANMRLHNRDCGESLQNDRQNPQQCCFCHKYYASKSTLQIHYKSVHFRQLHQCTVQGCNMVFTSSRSRNRHSANVNLHPEYSPGQQPPMQFPPGATTDTITKNNLIPQNTLLLPSQSW